MAATGLRRVALGVVAGGVVWGIWSTIINMVILMPRYAFAQANHELLSKPRYPLFIAYWFVTLFALTYILTWVYASARATFGPGPVTALRVGLLIGFATSFPLSLTMAAWAPFGRSITLGWMLDLWVGSILATLVSAWLYKGES
jgi:hypothetical protein